MTTHIRSKVKIAPHSKESEMMVLGCMLTKINHLNIAADAMESADFYYTEHQTIFSVLKVLYKSDKPADIHLVGEQLKQINKLEEVGGISYLVSLAQYAGTSAYIEEYVELIQHKSILRRLIAASQDIEKGALEDPVDVSTFLDGAQAKLFAISQATNRNPGKTVRELLSGVASLSGLPYLKELEERQATLQEKGEEALSPDLPTGFYDLDKMINGLAPSNLLIFAGRPGMGKTAFALNVAEHVCFQEGDPVGIFSLEMSGEQLVHRMICSQSGVESDKIRTGDLKGDEFQKIVATTKKMENHTMVIDDQPGLNIIDLRARARRMKEVYEIKLLVVDYLQLLSGTGSRIALESRQQEIAEISRMLKNLARELHIPVLCGSQLSRRVEERTGHRPMMSDLRESGSIEQDADVVMLLFRPEYYSEEDKPGIGEVIVGKNRHGRTGSVRLTYIKELARFVNRVRSEEEEPL
ncbi:MAG: replicative DNA helicase [Simkaniaceae bacterium]|nr:replicative DNA helicase [Simkaniaceae bacterium]